MNEKEYEENMNKFDNVLNDCRTLRGIKFKQYGKCYDTFGTFGIVIRLKDKIERLINYHEAKLNNLNLDNDYKKINETVKDTLMDIVNYSAMGIMIMDEEFEKMQRKLK